MFIRTLPYTLTSSVISEHFVVTSMPPLPSSLTRQSLRSVSVLSSLFASTTKPRTMDSTPPTYPTRNYTPRKPDGPFPYTTADLTPTDAGNDSSFYSTARFVAHIDDNAIINLRQYYDHNLPQKGRILDFCSSWISHYPPRIEDAVEKDEIVILGTGMNEAELRKNLVLNMKGGQRWTVQDLNEDPDVKLPDNDTAKLDAATCVVSIDYLTKPVEVLRSIRQHMNEAGQVHLIISNRCFPTKAVGRWLKVSEDEKLEMVGDYLWWSGWRNIEILEIVKAGQWFQDPLWVVRGTNTLGNQHHIEKGQL